MRRTDDDPHASADLPAVADHARVSLAAPAPPPPPAAVLVGAPPGLAPPSVGTLADPTVPVERFVPGELLPDPPPTSTATPGHGRSEFADPQRLSLLDALPVAVFLTDAAGSVVFANLRLAEMIGYQRGDLLGRNVLDFVDVTDLDFVAELFAHGNEYGNDVMGPSRIRYVDAAGESHWTQVWARQAPPEFGIEGFLVSLTGESVRDVLATAVSAVAADDPLERTLLAIANSARAHPLVGRGAVLVVEPAAADDDVRFRVAGNWPLDDRSVNAFGTPWRQALVETQPVDVPDVGASALPAGAIELLSAHGVRALFARPLRDVDGAVVGVFVLFRETEEPSSPNQEAHLEDIVRLAGLAFAQSRRRVELETAARTDALTGVANRTAFNERLHLERRHADVLFVDLDHFKAVNDTFGHDIGDAVIVESARRIARAVRRVDTVYRTGGDEFVVVCESTGSDPAQRVALAERIVDRLMAPFDVGDHRVRVSATVGVSRGDHRTLDDTVRAADRALYAAKERGRSGWAHAADAVPA